MATATRTITINAAFLQEIKEDAEELRQMLQSTAALLRHFQVPPRELVEALGQLRDQLALHFALEEAYGYFEDAIATEPRLSRRACALRCEHGSLFVELCELEELAERLLYHEAPHAVLRRIAAGYHHFHEAFLIHESHENDLILESLADELGSGD